MQGSGLSSANSPDSWLRWPECGGVTLPGDARTSSDSCSYSHDEHRWEQAKEMLQYSPSRKNSKSPVWVEPLRSGPQIRSAVCTRHARAFCSTLK